MQVAVEPLVVQPQVELADLTIDHLVLLHHMELLQFEVMVMLLLLLVNTLKFTHTLALKIKQQ